MFCDTNKQPIIDFSFVRAAIVLPKEHSKIKFYLVGAGGTGSFAAHNSARLCLENVAQMM